MPSLEWGSNIVAEHFLVDMGRPCGGMLEATSLPAPFVSFWTNLYKSQSDTDDYKAVKLSFLILSFIHFVYLQYNTTETLVFVTAVQRYEPVY